MGFLIVTFSERVGREEESCRCWGLFCYPGVLFVFVSIWTEHQPMAIMQDRLHSSAFVGSFIYWSQRNCHCGIFKMGCEVIPRTERAQGETRLKRNDLSIQRPRVCSESFQWDTFSPEDAVKKLSCSSPRELWTHFFTFTPELCKVECRTIIKAVTEVKWELGWPVCRGMVSCRPGSQTPQLTHREGRPDCISHKNQKMFITAHIRIYCVTLVNIQQ